MNPRSLILLSLALNLALGVVLMRRPASPAAPAPLRRVAVAAPAPPSAAVGGPVSAPVREAFDWARLAAADFHKYRDNLRAVGCPELTVRDIITAEVNAQFQARRRALVADFQVRFWDLLAKNRELEKIKEWQQPMNKLNAEREALLAEVLGDEPDLPAEERLARSRESFEQQYAWLPLAKRSQIVALEIEFQERQQALQQEVSQRADSKWTDADKARRKALTEELDTARQQWFTPEEFAEFGLRNSGAAQWAANLRGFEVSETEWRAVAMRRMEFNEAMKKLDQTTSGEVRSRMKAEWQAQLQATLGPERYAAYTLAQDGRYQQTRRITQRFGLSDSIAAQAYEMQKATQEAADRLRGDKSLDPAARQAALAAIQQETERTLEAALGQNVFRTYRKYNGKWLESVNPPPGE